MMCTLVCAAEDGPDIKIQKLSRIDLNKQCLTLKASALHCACKHCTNYGVKCKLQCAGNGSLEPAGSQVDKKHGTKSGCDRGKVKREDMGQTVEKAAAAMSDEAIEKGVKERGLLGFIVFVYGMPDFTNTKRGKISKSRAKCTMQSLTTVTSGPHGGLM